VRWTARRCLDHHEAERRQVDLSQAAQGTFGADANKGHVGARTRLCPRTNQAGYQFEFLRDCEHVLILFK
jgi:hypothetical protein